MIREKEEMSKDIRPEAQANTSQVDDLKVTVARIQRRYGNDLEAFFRDAKASIARRNADAAKTSFAQ